ncbi:Hypothetical predicted protein [Marmota monax]|uniref:Uncharacterized protein n=1 Tax=Marmota monax TaxID=9995 RepID=A0A5E4CS55_MARMO|nr:hypothetical protein GHT09_014410 [Marmota monax]VTJ84637.1 Hypothetical predicted protein [Marmota monax]
MPGGLFSGQGCHYLCCYSEVAATDAWRSLLQSAATCTATANTAATQKSWNSSSRVLLPMHCCHCRLYCHRYSHRQHGCCTTEIAWMMLPPQAQLQLLLTHHLLPPPTITTTATTT